MIPPIVLCIKKKFREMTVFLLIVMLVVEVVQAICLTTQTLNLLKKTKKYV